MLNCLTKHTSVAIDSCILLQHLHLSIKVISPCLWNWYKIQLLLQWDAVRQWLEDGIQIITLTSNVDDYFFYKIKAVIIEWRCDNNFSLIECRMSLSLVRICMMLFHFVSSHSYIASFNKMMTRNLTFCVKKIAI